MADALQIFFKLFGLFVVIFMIYLIVAGSITLTLYTRVGQGDPKGFWYTDRTKLQKYIFKSWLAWAGTPATFSMLSNSTPVSYTLYKQIPGVLSNCMISCESANSRGKTPKCVGFIYQPGTTSNTCYLASTMDGIVSNTDVPGMTSNTLYFIDGLDSARQYKSHPNKVQSDAGSVTGTGYSTSNLFECWSNCTSQTDCNGILMKKDGKCNMAKKLDPTKFTTTTDTSIEGILYLTTHDPLKTSTSSYY